MYVTTPLSVYRKDPNKISEIQTVKEEEEGSQNSGYLVITDEESSEAEEDKSCFGDCKVERIKNLPFPQNKLVDVVYTVYFGDTRRTRTKTVLFIPVIKQPLSLNRYYVIRATGRHRGQAYLCSKEEDMTVCCFRNIVNDLIPRSLDHTDIYQQVEIFKSRRGFAAKSVAPDGIPHHFLRRSGWRVYNSSLCNRKLGEALGLNVSLRMPELVNFSMSNKFQKAEVVGKWYCPFVFIMDRRLNDQMSKSLFYEMTMEQTWEEIYACTNDNTIVNNVVAVNVTLQKEEIKLFDEEAMKDNNRGADGFVWFKHVKDNEDGSCLGLSSVIVEKMKLIVEKGGWVGEGSEREVKIEKEFKGKDGWKKFGCFVLVERFALRRMDRTLLLTCEYKQIHQIQSKWE